MKTSKLLVLLLTFGLVIGLAGSLQAAPPQYRYYTTGLGSESNPSDPWAINDNGQVVVKFNNRTYLWSLKGGLTDLGDLGGGKTKGYAINNLGQVVGESYINSTTSHAFLWQAGQMTDLGGLAGGVKSSAVSINNLGVVIGSTSFSDNSVSMFRWTQAGGLQPLDLQGGMAFKIADDGRMVGSRNNHAWLWNSPGAGTDLGILPGFSYAQAEDINSSGVVIGWAGPPDYGWPCRGLIWTQAHGLQDLGTVDDTPGNSRVAAVNNLGYIVGWSDHLGGQFAGGCLWSPTGAKYALDYLPIINKPAGITIGDANAINNRGIIIGSGWGLDYMLVPTQMLVPETLLLLLQ